MKYTREQIEKAISIVSSKILTGKFSYRGNTFASWVLQELEEQQTESQQAKSEPRPTLNDHPHADNIRAWAKHLEWDGDLEEAMSVPVYPDTWPVTSISSSFESSYIPSIIDFYYSGHRTAGRLLEFLYDNGVKDISTTPPAARTEDEQRIDDHYRMIGVDDEQSGWVRAWYLYDRQNYGLIQYKWEVGKTKLEDLK